MTIKSVGCFDPPFHGSNCDDTVGSIVVNGIELSQNKPGFNFVVIDFKTGEQEKSVSFDTHGEAGAYEKLEEFIGGLDNWKIICVAVKDDGKNYLPDSAIKNFVNIFILCLYIIFLSISVQDYWIYTFDHAKLSSRMNVYLIFFYFDILGKNRCQRHCDTKT